jgi:phosphoribosyl 1,2-cyclic phosphodiesterase
VLRQLDLFAPRGSRSAPARVGLGLVPLQSGSEGNATLVSAGGTALLVDCGISPAHLRARLEPLGRTPAELACVLVTHEHTDHAGGAGALARRFGVPLYMNEPTARACSERILRKKVEREAVRILPESGRLAFRDGRPVDPGERHDLAVEWIPVPHDASAPLAFAVERETVRAAVLTDIGHASAAIRALFETLDLALLETNYDRDRLRDGPYPRSLRRRIASSLGHLSNVEAARLVRDHASPRLRHLVLGHISQVNNEPELAKDALRAILARRSDLDVALHVAFRDRASGAIEV